MGFIGPNNSGKTTALQTLALWEIGVGIIGVEMTPSLWGWLTVISPIYGLLSFIVSALVGVFFGHILHGKQQNSTRLMHLDTIKRYYKHYTQ